MEKPLRHQLHYPKFRRIYTNFFNVLGISSPVIFVVYPLSLSITNHEAINLGDLVFVVCFGLLLGFMLILTGNFLTEIMSDDKGLHINFLWHQVNIPWEEVQDLKPIFNLGVVRNISILRTHSLTEFHRAYGILYSFTLSPSLIIYRGLSDYDKLVERINAHIRNNRRRQKRNLG